MTEQRIEADVLIRGDGTAVDAAVVLIDAGAITYAGAAAAAPPTPGAAVINVPVVMPGMWDAHCHFFGIRRPNLEALVTDPVMVRSMRVTRDARRALLAGFTSVREVGGLGVYLARAVADGYVEGPDVYAAGAILSTTGGHGDIHSVPEEWIHGGIDDLELCDGPDECRKAVRRQLRKGARVIKVCASGGVLSEYDDPQHQQFSHEELVAIVDEATKAERLVAAHCHGKAGIMAAVRAGVKTIEHGTYLDREAAKAMADSGSILVATRFVGAELLSQPPERGLAEFARRKLAETYRRGREAVQAALEAGVTIAAGTDILTSDDQWGHNGRELSLLVECGMTPDQAIVAATAAGPLTVGPQAPGSGILEEGMPADVIAVTIDPRRRIEVLADADEVTHVWKGGSLVKTPDQRSGTATG
ncbi:MAG TPA: amidohydrolase family protein [Acidimicrobiia bacterium]|nr:amidohydrolase family protein [Acidimicrobiia bacterium]